MVDLCTRGYLNSSAMLMIAIISWFSRAVKDSIRALAGTGCAPRPVATQRLRLAQLIRSLPAGILLPSCPIRSDSQPGFYLNFYILCVPPPLNSLACFHKSICGFSVI